MTNFVVVTLREKWLNTKFFSGQYFPVFGLNRVKYGPEKTPYLDTFQAVLVNTVCVIKNRAL